MSEWQKLDEETVYSGYRNIVRKRFQRPDGAVGEYDIKVESDAVCVLALTEDEKVVLVEQFRPGPETNWLEMPGGGIDEGESPLEAMQREFLEETGYKGEFEFLATSIYCPYSTRKKYNFIAKKCQKVADPSETGGEATQVVEMSLPEFVELAYSGKLPESDTAFIGLRAINKK